MQRLRILVTGASGFLGAHAVAAVAAAGHTPLTASRTVGDAAVDLTAPGMIAAVVEALRPDLVLNLAAMSRLDACERDPDAARAANVALPEQLARRFAGRVLHVSTDLVFDGRAAPYAEDAAPAPLSVYGATKAEGEERVRAHGGRVVRLPLLFGPDASGRGATASLRAAVVARRASPLFTNEYRTPLHARDAAEALVATLLDADGPALLHAPGPERVSRWELARSFCAVNGLDASWLRPVECQDPLRPRDVSLAGVIRPRRTLAAMLADA